jgi:hypothetical protein
MVSNVVVSRLGEGPIASEFRPVRPSIGGLGIEGGDGGVGAVLDRLIKSFKFFGGVCACLIVGICYLSQKKRTYFTKQVLLR